MNRGWAKGDGNWKWEGGGNGSSPPLPVCLAYVRDLPSQQNCEVNLNRITDKLHCGLDFLGDSTPPNFHQGLRNNYHHLVCQMLCVAIVRKYQINEVVKADLTVRRNSWTWTSWSKCTASSGSGVARPNKSWTASKSSCVSGADGKRMIDDSMTAGWFGFGMSYSGI